MIIRINKKGNLPRGADFFACEEMRKFTNNPAFSCQVW